MRKLLLMVAAIGVMSMSAPAMADVGILNAAGTGFAQPTYSNVTDTFTVTIGFHLTTTLTKVDWAHFGFVIDTIELTMLTATPAGPWLGASNLSGLPTWLNNTVPPGVWVIISNFVSISGTTTLFPTVFYPVARFQFHVASTNDNGFLDFYAGGWSATSGGVVTAHNGIDIYSYTSNFQYFTVHSDWNLGTTGGGGNSGVVITPEPGSMALLLAGVGGLAGGVWRRRRR